MEISKRGGNRDMLELKATQIIKISDDKMIKVNIIRIDSMLFRLVREKNTERNSELISLLCSVINQNLINQKRLKRKTLYIDMSVRDIKKCIDNNKVIFERKNTFYSCDKEIADTLE